MPSDNIKYEKICTEYFYKLFYGKKIEKKSNSLKLQNFFSAVFIFFTEK